MHVLVTGGAGFIGSHSVDLLLVEGARVRVLDNFSTGKRCNLAPHPLLEIIEGDIRDLATVENALQGISHVLHLAAQVSVATSLEQPIESASINLSGFLNVLDASLRAGASRFVYASSAAAYGIPARLPLYETDPSIPITPYGLEKAINDQYAYLYHDLYDFSTLGMRYFNVYGPRQDAYAQHAGVINVFAQRLYDEQPITLFGDGLQTRDFIYVVDAARANVAALGSTAGGHCNVASGRSVSIRDLVDAFSTVTGLAPTIHYSPARPGDIRQSAADVKRLNKLLNSRPITPLDEGIELLWNALN